MQRGLILIGISVLWVIPAVTIAISESFVWALIYTGGAIVWALVTVAFDRWLRRAQSAPWRIDD